MPRTLNICLISREYPPFYGGGIGSYSLRWSQLLASGGHRIVVLTVGDDGQLRRQHQGAATIIRFPLVRGRDWSRPDPAIDTPWTRAAFASFSPVSIFSMQIAEQLPELQREFAFDIIEAPDTGALHWFALNDRRIGPGFRAPRPAWITCIHSPTQWISRWNQSPLRGRQDHELIAMERDCIHWCDALVCPSAAMAREAAALWQIEPGRIAVIPYPLGELETQPSSAPAGAAQAGAKRILFAGRLEPRKGIQTLLAGFAQALAAGADLHLDLVGEDMPEPGSWRPHGQRCLQQHIPAGHRERVRLHGKASPEQVAEFQARADAIVIPSPMDNFPNTCMEAMAKGKLVIAARAGGMAEMIEHGRSGILFEPADSAACAAALRQVAAMTALQSVQIGAAAAKRIRDVCGNGRILEARLQHMEQALERCRRGASISPSAVRRAFIINPGSAPAESLETLAAAVADPDRGIDFAHGWVQQDDAAHVFGTPTLQSLALAPRDVGPLAVAAEALDSLGLGDDHPLLRPGPAPGTFHCESAHTLALLLATAGRPGAVLPHIRTNLPPEQAAATPADSALAAQLAEAQAELARIHRSRGWRFLQAVYRILHILKGRGVRGPMAGPDAARSYDRPPDPQGARA